MNDNIEYKIASDLWSKNIRRLTDLGEYSIKKIESLHEVNLEYIDELLLDNWEVWNREMEVDFFKNMRNLNEDEEIAYSNAMKKLSKPTGRKMVF